MRLVLEIIIFLSLSGILFLLIKALPRLDDSVFERRKRKIADSWFFNLISKLDEKFLYVFEYFLRQLKVWLLKTDNKISAKLEKFKKNNEVKTINLKELKEEKKEEEQEIS